MPKLTSKIALEFATRIEDLKNQISLVYREVGETYGFDEANVIRDVVSAREQANECQQEADGLIASLDDSLRHG